MRIKFMQEDKPDNVVGTLFLPNSIKHDGRQMPVLLNGHDDEIIGFANDLERDDELWLSVDISFRADFLEQFKNTNDKITDWFDFSGYGNDVERESDTPDIVIKSINLKAIYAIPKPAPAIIKRKE